jgi:nucleotide-binding universal stress UspA family protein
MLAPGIQITYPVVTPDQQARQNVAALTYLERVEQRLVEKGLRVSSATSAGSPAAEIVKYAEANGISLIAISTHGRSGVERWVLGSVAERLLHLGNTAMLTVRASRE